MRLFKYVGPASTPTNQTAHPRVQPDFNNPTSMSGPACVCDSAGKPSFHKCRSFPGCRPEAAHAVAAASARDNYAGRRASELSWCGPFPVGKQWRGATPASHRTAFPGSVSTDDNYSLCRGGDEWGRFRLSVASGHPRQKCRLLYQEPAAGVRQLAVQSVSCRRESLEAGASTPLLTGKRSEFRYVCGLARSLRGLRRLSPGLRFCRCRPTSEADLLLAKKV